MGDVRPSWNRFGSDPVVGGPNVSPVRRPAAVLVLSHFGRGAGTAEHVAHVALLRANASRLLLLLLLLLLMVAAAGRLIVRLRVVRPRSELRCGLCRVLLLATTGSRV